MPIYEYRCQSCGHELERLQRMSDAALTDCPECGRSALKRLVSAAGFRLKGAGWYETDFKKSNQRNLVDKGVDKGVDSGAGSGSDKSAGGNAGESAKDSSKTSTAESPKDSKSSDSGSSKGADKPSKTSAPAASS